LIVRAPTIDADGAGLADRCFPVRAIYFDKTPDSNWNVAWHQNLTIAVRERRDAAGFGPWSVKAGVPHVQPPVELLEHLVAVRLHLDPCVRSSCTHRRRRPAPFTGA
jgi:hypothetical protein